MARFCVLEVILDSFQGHRPARLAQHQQWLGVILSSLKALPGTGESLPLPPVPAWVLPPTLKMGGGRLPPDGSCP
jgi:hypothetical protein